jgi:hypothetical protein
MQPWKSLAMRRATRLTKPRNARKLEIERNRLQEEKQKTDDALKQARENLALAQEAQTKLNVELKNICFAPRER